MMKKTGSLPSSPKRIASRTAPADTTTSAKQSENVLVEQFRRDFAVALKSALDKSAVASSPKQEIAYYGAIAERLVQVGGRLERLAEDQMVLADKAELLLEFGDKLYKAQEYRAASSFFYERVIQLLGIHPGEQFDPDIGTPSLPSNRSGQLYVRCAFGLASCTLRAECCRDQYVRHPGTLERMIGALGMLRQGMEVAVSLEKKHSGQFAWLIVNGSLSVFSTAKPLVELGFPSEVVGYLKWCLVALESVVALSTVKYVLWKLQLCTAICECYEAMALKDPPRGEQLTKAALSCAEYAVSVVQQLRKEEELDLPLPVHVQQILDRAQNTASMLVVRAKSSTNQEILSRAALEAAFHKPADRIRAAMAIINKITSAEKLAQSPHLFLAPYSQEHEGTVAELLLIVIDSVRPLLQELESQGVAAAEISLSTVFPLEFHLLAVRFCYCLGKSQAQELKMLLASIRMRINDCTRQQLPEKDATGMQCLVSVIDAMDGMRQSLESVKAVEAAENAETKKVQPTILATGKPLPSEASLKALVIALKSCIHSDCGELCRFNRDLLIAAALTLWRDAMSPLLESLELLDARELPVSSVKLLSTALETIHLVFTATDFEDALLHGQVALSCGTLFLTTKSPPRAAGVARRALERINEYREELSLHQAFPAAMMNQLGIKPDQRSLSDATLSFDMFSIVPPKGRSTSQAADGTSKAGNDDVGVPGTGAQFGRLHQDLCCVQVDLILLLYRAELQDASVTNALSPLSLSTDHGIKSNDEQSKHLLETESRLVSDCCQNGYMKALLLIQRLYLPLTTTEERQKIAGECLKALRRVEIQERDLQQRAAKFSTPLGAKSQPTTVPVAPIVITRSSSAVTLQIVEFLSAIPVHRRRPVHYYMVYAKLSGVGTAVSLNNNQLPGTARPIYPARSTTATIYGLTPNESYVFAVAAFDDQCALIQGIGETSEPVIALNPLPLPLCYGYLAQACHELQLAERAKQAARYLLDIIVSTTHTRRPSWRASPFYREALQRDVVSRLPTPILDKCAAAMEILCDAEAGDPELDGLLVASEPDAHSLLSEHVSVLESARRISIGVEIASAAGNRAMVNRLCFKGYQVLLPLLHLVGGCGGLAYPALMTFHQGLVTAVEGDSWGLETRNLNARFGFELFRISVLQTNRDMLKVTIPLVAPCPTGSNSSVLSRELSPELLGLDEVLALHKLVESGSFGSQTTNDSPPQSSSSAPPGKSAPPASKGSGTPNQTPRAAISLEDGNASGVPQLPTIREVLESVSFDAPKAFKMLEAYAHSDMRTVEVFCKIASAALNASTPGNLGLLLSSIKISGDFSNDFRTLLVSVGGGTLLPDEASPPDYHASQPTDPPISARAQAVPDKAEPKVRMDGFATDTTAPASLDDMYLFHWCGELFFLKAIITSRKIAERRPRSCTSFTDVNHGPITEDNIHDLLRGDAPVHRPPTLNQLVEQGLPDEATAETTGEGSEHSSSTPQDVSGQDQFGELLDTYLEQTAASCRLFHRGQSWQSLQAAAQHLWNTVLCAWVPPSEIAVSESRLSDLEHCVEVLLDMIELSTATSRYESLLGSHASPGQLADDQAASTIMVSAAMGKLRVKDVWLSGLITYTTQSFACARSWERIVRLGQRYYNYCGSTREGSRFAETTFPILVHAQTQILKRQDAVLAAAQAERTAFVAAFHEQEAKRKKKKSRLVVEEVATPEELAFRARDSEMEGTIQALTQTRDRERSELHHLTLIHEGLQKSRNKCEQALDHCRELVAQYRRSTGHQTGKETSIEELSVLRRQVISSFIRCVTSCRQKRQKRLTCQALQELGDFHLACENVSEAAKYWLEAIDNAFSTLRIMNSWRQVISIDLDDDANINGDANATKIVGDELWVALQSCAALGKLILQTESRDTHQAVEYALMAATIFARLYACAMPHPSKPFLYGSYSVIDQLWPGRDLLQDSESVSAFTVVSALVCSQETLLQYEAEHAVTAMPVIAGYEYLASTCLDDTAHVANALRLRVTALAYAGRFREAFALLPRLFFGSSALSSTENSEEVPVFRGNRGLQDPGNAAALSWLTSLSVPKLAADLKNRCRFHGPLVRQIVMALLRLAVAVAVLKAHPDAQTLAVRTSTQNMAKDVLAILNDSNGEQSSELTAEEHETAALTGQMDDAWDAIELLQLRCDVMLQEGRLLFASGKWNAALELSERTINELTGVNVRLSQATPSSTGATASLDHELKYSSVSQRATLVGKCCRLGIACHVARGDTHGAIALANRAIHEAQEAGEKLLSHELELQKAQAMVCLGMQDEAEDILARLSSCMAQEYADDSALYARVLHTIGAVVRSKAAFSANPELLNDVCRHLTAAKLKLDRLLRAEGWVGVPGIEGNEIDSVRGKTRDKFLNLYYPALPAFVQVSADLAWALAECPVASDAGQDEREELGPAFRGEQVLTLVRHALLVFDELPLPRHASATKAQLLLLQGSTLKKKLLARFLASDGTDEAVEALRTSFAECVDSLKLGISVSIVDGGHDRALIRRALVQLVELYVTGFFKSDRDEHVHAAFHYLRLAVRVCEQESTLFDSVELQRTSESLNTSSLTAEQQLPSFITDAIGKVAMANSLEAGDFSVEPSRSAAATTPAPPPDAAKKTPAGTTAASGSRPPSSSFDPAHAINYFVRSLREQNAFPTGNAILRETTLRLHTFLAQAHPTYAKLCCLAELPQVPPLAPETQPGLVCTHWGQDMTPGVSFTTDKPSLRSNMTLFFTLGTTKIDMTEGAMSAENADAAFQRMERFVTTPFLSKRAYLPAAVINEARMAISHLRVDMEDEQSVVIDKAAFPARFRSVLRRLQLLFRKPKPSRGGEDDSETMSDDEVRDVFGNAIRLPPTLEAVRALENIFTITKAVSAAENTLCYFLRDLLD